MMNTQDFGANDDNGQSQFGEALVAINAQREAAWRRILFAFLAILAAAIVFLGSGSLVWTGGLLVAAIWVFGALRNLRQVNAAASSVQQSLGLNVLLPLPTWLKIANVLVIPLATTLALLSLLTYVTPETFTNAPQVDVIRMYNPSDAEAMQYDYEYFTGVELDIVGGACEELIIDVSVVVGETNELVFGFENVEYGLPEGAHRIVIGTSDPASDAGDTMVVNDAYCL